MKSGYKYDVSRRLKILEGQLRGLQKMVQEEKYCIDILHQSLAIKEGISRVEDLILENHLTIHVIKQVKGGQSGKAVKEILSIYKLSKKKN